MPIEPISLISSSLSGLAVAFKLVEFGLQVKDVPIDSLIFIELLVSVQADLDHAMACQREIEQDLAAQPSYHRDWILGTILRTVKALDGIGSFILAVQVDQEKSPSLFRRINYVLHDYKKLSDREKWLRASHTSLLSAINAMHMLIYPRFRTTEVSSADIPISNNSPQNDLTPPANQEPKSLQISTLPSRSRFPFESSQSLPILTESININPEWSPQSPTTSLTLHSPSSPPETEYAYPELENAFNDARRSIDSRKSTDSLQRPSRQKPSESTQSLSSTLYPVRNGSQSTLSSTAMETRSRQSSRASLPEEQFPNVFSLPAGQYSNAYLLESLSSDSKPSSNQNATTTTRRPSRQKPRPQPHSSFSDTVLASADVRLDSLSRLSSPCGSVDMQQSPITTLEGDEKIGEFSSVQFVEIHTDTYVVAATVAYDELVDYIQLLRRQSTRGHRHSINISV
jgi:hypothetical protein